MTMTVTSPENPLLTATQSEPALEWWGRLTNDERATWAAMIGQTFKIDGPNGRMTVLRDEGEIARLAFGQNGGALHGL